MPFTGLRGADDRLFRRLVGQRSALADYVFWGASRATNRSLLWLAISSGNRTRFTAHRVAIETTAGVVVRERADPRSSFDGHDLLTPWDPLHRAYFNGYAMWTYLTTPFFMVMPGFEVTEIAPWQEGAERWRGLRVRFPGDVASHSREQDFYFGEDFLLRRHDYHVDVAGGFPAAQYVSDIVLVDGIRFPTRRRAYMRAPDLKPIRDLLMVAIDFTHFRFMA